MTILFQENASPGIFSAFGGFGASKPPPATGAFDFLAAPKTDNNAPPSNGAKIPTLTGFGAAAPAKKPAAAKWTCE